MRIVKDVSGPIATITINRPEKLNAMDSTMYRQITEALLEIEADDDVRVGIITGAGDRAFSAGADLKEMHGHAREGHWKPWTPDRWDQGITLSTPLIAAIDGYALAGGLELALVCDIRLATPQSTFGCPEIKWNLLHGYGALRLPAVVGLTNAMMLLLTGEFITADEALRIGLINRLVEPSELLAQARSLAETIATNAGDAIRMTKELALRGVDGTLEQGLRLYRAFMDQLEGSDEQLTRLGGFGTHRTMSNDAEQ